MDNIILTLHPVTDAALDVLKDPRNANLLIQVDASNDDAASQGKTSALSLSLDRAPKRGTDYVIGRHHDADILLTDPASSARHCMISVSGKGVPVLHERSTNGTLVDGKHCNNQSVEVQSGIQIDIRDAVFEVQVPWRGNSQQDYEYKARRANESRAKTPLESMPSGSAPIHTTWAETLGPYTFTKTSMDNLKLGHKEVARIEIVRKGRSFFAAKRFSLRGLGEREIRAWKKIIDSKIKHPNIIHLEDILQSESGPVLIMELLPKGNFSGMFCEKGTLVPHDKAAGVMKQLLSALEYLHKLDIVHTAVQLDNLLVCAEEPIHIKLTGFEFSSCGGVAVSSLSVCPAPEIWERHYRDRVAPWIWEKILTTQGYSEARPKPWCGSPVDIWSAGVVCSQLTLGIAPCYLDRGKSDDEQATDYVDLLLAIRSASPIKRAEAWTQKLGLSSRPLPPLLLKFLQKLLEPETESRANAGDCLAAPWLTQNAQNLMSSVEEPQVEESACKRRKLNSAGTE